MIVRTIPYLFGIVGQIQHLVVFYTQFTVPLLSASQQLNKYSLLIHYF